MAAFLYGMIGKIQKVGNVMKLNEELIDFIKKYSRHDRQRDSKEEIKKSIKAIKKNQNLVSVFPKDIFDITYSLGEGNWADVPWVAFLDKKMCLNPNKGNKTSVRYGYYIGFLFDHANKGVYLVLGTGAGQYKRIDAMEDNVDYWQERFSGLVSNENFSFYTPDLKSTNSTPKNYEKSTILSKYYSLNDLEVLTKNNLLEDLSFFKSYLIQIKNDIEETKTGKNWEEKQKAVIDKKPYLSSIKLEKGTRPEPKSKHVPAPKRDRRHQKIDRVEREKQNVLTGKLTEEAVFEHEKKRLRESKYKDLRKKAKDVIHVSKEKGDGDGYDILSFEKLEKDAEIEPLYIEVKATKQTNNNAPFFMSSNEIEEAKKKKGQYVIARLYQDGSKKDNTFKAFTIFNPIEKLEYKAKDYICFPLGE